jgi:hypothetical protein
VTSHHGHKEEGKEAREEGGEEEEITVRTAISIVKNARGVAKRRPFFIL